MYDPSLITIEFSEDQSNMHIQLDFDKIHKEGFQAISDFLRDLQMYKSTANATEGTKFFNKYCEVDTMMLKVKGVVDENRRPRSIEL